MLELMLRFAASAREAAVYFTSNPDKWMSGALTDRYREKQCAIGRVHMTFFGLKKPATLIDEIQAELLSLRFNQEVWRELRSELGAQKYDFLSSYNDSFWGRNSDLGREKIIEALHLYADYFDELAAHQADLEGATVMQPIQTTQTAPAYAEVRHG